MTRRRVYVHGVGAVTPLGATWPETAAALAEGRSAIAPITRFDARGFPCTVAAALPAGDAEDRRVPLALAAAREAWAATRVDAAPERIGIFAGAEPGRPRFDRIVALARAGGAPGLAPGAAAVLARATQASPAAVVASLARELGATGSVAAVSLACASGAVAIAEAARAVARGECDVALCGGVGADVDPLLLAGFGLLGALSEKGRSCPFDAGRDGFVLGEGAGFVVLAAERAGAVAELRGTGRTLDAHHLTAPDPTGDGAARAMRLALAESGLAGVDHVQAHGTSTPLNDAVEARAIRRVLGRALADAHVSSVKGALGHTIAAAGALGFLCAVHAVARGIVLPTAGLAEPDPECDLPHVTGRALSRRVETALANAFAFGGANCSLVVARA